MTTGERAAALAGAAARFPGLFPPTADDLLATVRAELGHESALDGFVPYCGGYTRAVAPSTILHVVSGNTPHAALQTLLRGLLLGSMNLVKFPGGGLGEIEGIANFLPGELAVLVESSRVIEPGWWERADAWVVFGDDRTIEALRAECPAGTIFDGHGTRVSYAVVFDDPDFVSCAGVARDVSQFDQGGCLSPHVVYVAGDAEAYAGRLAVEMAKTCRLMPPAEMGAGSVSAVSHLREAIRFEALSNPGVRIWCSEGLPGWTVVFERSEEFRFSPLDRCIYVKPLPGDLSHAVRRVRGITGAVGIFPASLANAGRVEGLGASRICAVGRMQEAPFWWHSEARPNLGVLVRWVDFEPGVC